MKKILYFLTIISVSLIPKLLFAESLQLTTYYPAPFGVYEQMRLFPRNPFPLATACTPGSLYVRNDTNTLQFCGNTSLWGPLGGAWTLDSVNNYIYPTGTPATPPYKIGIGTTAPTALLHLSNSNPGGYTTMEIENTGAQSGAEIILREGNDDHFKIRYYSKNDGTLNQLQFWGLNGISPATDPKMVIDRDNGNVGIGTTAPNEKVVVVTENNEDSGWYSYNNTDSSDFDFNVYRAKGTATTPLPVTGLNNLGSLTFLGYDGNNFIPGANFQAFVDGVPGINSMPGRLEFRTTPAGSNTLALRMVIKNDGNVGIGTTSPMDSLHIVTSSLGIPTAKWSAEPFVDGDLIIEGDDATLHIIGKNSSATSSAILLSEVDGTGTYLDMWALWKQTVANGSNFFINYRGADGNWWMGTPMFTFSKNGEIGIGTTNPSSPLHIQSTSGSGDEIYIENTVSSSDIHLNSNNTATWSYIRFSTNNVPRFIVGTNKATNNKFQINETDTTDTNARLVIAPGGNVGIGNTSPASAFQAGVPNDATYSYIQLDNGIAAPPATDCDNDAETGRLYLQRGTNVIYVCNGAAMGWDTVTLNP